MKSRDRMFLMGLLAAALLVGFYLLLVAPERRSASSLGGQLSAARQQRSAALAQVQVAQTAQAQYPTAYANVVRLGKAVPPSDDTPSLIYQLDNTSCACRVDFRKVSTAANAGAGTPGAVASVGGFAALPFQFTFTGGFFQLYHYFKKINDFTRINGDRLDVSGRLLSIEGFSVTGMGGPLQADVSATAYMLPPAQGLTATATPNGPAPGPAGTSTGSQPVNTSGPPSVSTTQPANTAGSPSGARLSTPTAVTQVGP